eukprot:CAMPEP_0168391574 /NCGR_PEP_ID=MMETSP0228-20121227/18054_1 /TAXON_ID=133427 /ORGANISM="Protoceratium reticulatum, Strain CCCM 535 (=CCMP 1889)" /LENGTH=158 /DNA_ID=CAMNT_0008404891 /DNA_START=66 /DNA_END=542 /DNA_ORIENTATION=+
MRSTTAPSSKSVRQKARKAEMELRKEGLQDNGTYFVRSHTCWEQLLKEKQSVVVMFTSKYCGSCQHMSAVYPILGGVLGKEATLAFVDLDESEQQISEGALGPVAFVPAFQVYKRGVQAGYFMASDEESLHKKLAEAQLTRRHGWGCLTGLVKAIKRE